MNKWYFLPITKVFIFYFITCRKETYHEHLFKSLAKGLIFSKCFNIEDYPFFGENTRHNVCEKLLFVVLLVFFYSKRHVLN